MFNIRFVDTSAINTLRNNVIRANDSTADFNYNTDRVPTVNLKRNKRDVNSEDIEVQQASAFQEDNISYREVVVLTRIERREEERMLAKRLVIKAIRKKKGLVRQ